MVCLPMNTLTCLLSNPSFREDFDLLERVPLDPARHSSPNARVHSEAVARRARELGVLNGCPCDDADLLEAAGFVHDIGKIAGTTSASASVDRLARYGALDPRLADLVRYHDVNLHWFLATTRVRGDPPSERAWRKLLARVDPRLLALLMVADRVDCPGGWRANEPLTWFLEQLRRRESLPASIVFDLSRESSR
jgi:hypothetical protein